jgi:hypothetical protein
LEKLARLSETVVVEIDQAAEAQLLRGLEILLLLHSPPPAGEEIGGGVSALLIRSLKFR